ncbi:MAG: phytanoyl-CoA dioxygenase family protein [Planctomycetota bacterium]
MPNYPLTATQIASFHADGWVHLPNFLTKEEVAELTSTYMRFLRRELPVQGRDYCDMTGDYGKPIEDFAILNVLLPRRYHPAWQGNVYEQRARATAAQLIGDDIALDYDQLIAKPPHKPLGVFHWHQDLGYWPRTKDTRTASFWLALDHVAPDNGVVRFVRASHREPLLRPHVPLYGDRNQNHTMVAVVDEQRDCVQYAELQPGDLTVHHERTVHGSSGNHSDRWRRGYVLGTAH